MTDSAAWLALVVATGSLVVAYLAYRAGRPTIKYHTELVVRYEAPPELDTRTIATVLVINQGTVPVTVDHIDWCRMPGNVQAERVSHSPLPHRV
jgi:hypothetical protein